MTAPDRDLEQAGWTLQQIVAIQLTAALEHIHRELAALDGYSSGSPEVSVRAESELTSVERAAEARWALSNAREDLRDQKAEVLRQIRELNDLCNQALRMRQPKAVTKPEDQKRNLCCSGQSGLHAQIEWGDPLCMMPAVKKGLCQKHYDAWRYARRRDGISTDGDYQPTGDQFHHTHT